MSALIYVLPILSVFSSIIEYKFRQNYGQIFYDYSGNSRHGVNGVSSLNTTGDTIATDRGAYFKSGRYMTLPSNDAPTLAFSLGPTFTITFWMYNDDYAYNFFTRISSDTNYFFYVKRQETPNAPIIQCKVAGTETSIITGIDFSFTRREWILISIQMTTTHLIVYQNGLTPTSVPLPIGGYSESGTYTTRIGDPSANIKMFIWYFVIEDGIIPPSTYVSTNTASSNCLTGIGTCACCGAASVTKFNDPDLGIGYMSSDFSPANDSSSTVCAPSSYGCALVLSLNCQCASKSCVFSRSGNTCQCINLSTRAIATATCACFTGYSDARGKCCEESCGDCANSTPNVCIGCKATFAVPDIIGCKCDVGYFGTAPLLIPGACAACHQECFTCVEALKCTSCKASLAAIHGTQGCYCPPGTYSTGSPLIAAGACVACHQECSTCTRADICTQCIAQYAYIDASQGCKCQTGYWGGAPLINAHSCTICYGECKTCIDGNSCTTCVSDNATPNAPLQGCSCNVGYKSLGPLLATDSCKECFVECATCTTPNACITCKDPNQVPDQIIGCNCKPGYYKDSNNTCKKCNIDCVTCNSASSCSTCISNNTYPGQDYCQCLPGYYNITKAPTTCVLCPNDCITCYNSTLCTQCSIIDAVPTNIGTCICPNNSWAVNNKCQCIEGLYMYEDLSYRECKSCDKSCISCSNALSCDTCEVNMQLDPSTNLCVTQCYSGQVLIHDTCRSCPSLCNTCDTSLSCTQCVDNAIYLSDTCSCGSGYSESDNQCTPLYFWANLTVSSENRLKLEFSRKPEPILTSQDFSVNINTSNSFSVAFIVKSQSIYHFYLTFTENVQQGTPVTLQILKQSVYSIDLYHLQNYTFQGFLYKQTVITESIKAIVSKTKAASQSAVAISLVIATVSSPAATWILINTIQLIAYMPINGNPLTPLLTEFFMAIGDFNLMPNAMSYAFNQEISSAPYSNAQKLGIETSVFWINFGPTATALMFFVAIWPTVLLLSKSRLGKMAIRFSRILSNYRYAVFIRFWIEAYLDVGFFSLIQIKATVNSPVTGFFNVVSASIGIICVILTPLALFVCSYISKDRILNSSDLDYHKRFGSFFEEFKNNKGFLSTQYYTVFFMRRLLYILAQVFLNNLPYLQICLNIVFTLVVIFYLVYYRPFAETNLLISAASSEFCVLVVFLISIMFLQTVSDDILPYLEYSIIFAVIACMGLEFFIAIYSFTINLKHMWMYIEKHRAKLILKNVKITT